MSSKILKFHETNQTLREHILNDVKEMTDISFNTIANTSLRNIDIQMLTPEESILQSIKNLLSLPKGGNALFPNRGEPLTNYLFTPLMEQHEAEAAIKNYIESGEPRITVKTVEAFKTVNEFNEQIITLNIDYSFKNGTEIHNAMVDIKSERQ